MHLKKIRILGCGASGGVPLITGEWGNCHPGTPENTRLRSSIFLQFSEDTEGKEVFNLLIDTSPDLRQQLLVAGISKIDAVLYTHAHHDHIGGLPDLRHLSLQQKKPIHIYADASTLEALYAAYDYVLETKDPLYPAFLESHLIVPYQAFSVEKGINVLPLYQQHGPTHSLAFRLEDIAYSTDFNDLPRETLSQLNDLRLWIVDCLRDAPHISHAHTAKTFELIKELAPQRSILTHMTQHLDYHALKNSCKNSHLEGVEPAYDGMEIIYQ